MLLVRRSRSSLALIALSLVAIGGVHAATARAEARTSVETNVVGFLGNQLDEYAGREGPFTAGVWSSPENSCWACNNGGPATGAAGLYVLTGSTRRQLRSESEQTIETAIATHQNANGSFTGPPSNTESSGITTMFFGVEFGTTYRLLASFLTSAQRARWQRSLAAAANFLISDGDTSFYANGNINLGYTEFLYLVWQATGENRFEQAYDESWAFTLAPPQSRFPGCGLVTLTTPTRQDGANGAGYLAETGEGGTGFDPEYSALQLDIASRLYLLSHDQRALRIANMLVNVLMPRINVATWMLNTSGGSRHSQQGREVGFMASAFAVLGLAGIRPELDQYILPQIEKEESWYPQPFQADSGVFRRALGADVTTIALAAAEPSLLSSYARPDGSLGPLAGARQNAPRSTKARHRNRRRHGGSASRGRGSRRRFGGAHK